MRERKRNCHFPHTTDLTRQFAKPDRAVSSKINCNARLRTSSLPLSCCVTFYKSQQNLQMIFTLIARLVLLPIISCISLSSSSDGKVSRKIQRVAIIGGGIAGLTLAHALENSPTCASYNNQLLQQEGYTTSSSSSRYGIETHIFDTRSTLGTGGAGIQLTGGMAVLRKINPQLQEAVARASVQLKRIKSFTKPWFGSDGNKAWPLFEMDIKDAIQNAKGRTEQELIIEDQVMSFTIMRSTLQDVLYQNLPDKCKDRLQRGKKLINLAANEAGIMCLFEDGTTSGPFDLVVGCDGIRSTVKAFVDSGEISSSSSGERKKNGDQSIYSGIKIQYAVQDTSNNITSSSYPTTDGEVCQYFGDGVYGLSGIYGTGENRPPTKAAFLIFRDENYNGPFSKQTIKQTAQENVDWRQDEESLKDSMIRKVHQAGIPKFQIEPVILDSKVFFELGVYFHNPLSFNGWSREMKGSGGRYCVLCGDAAHAMPPFLGQGGNQAIQDAFVLATKIFEFNELESRKLSSNYSSVDTSFATMLKDYENLRWNPTSSITAKSIFLGYLETGGKGLPSLFRDAFFFGAGKLGVAQQIYLDAATPKIYKE